MYLAKVYVTLKTTVNDPEGLTILGGLRDLGYDAVRSVRAGKYMEVRLDEEDEERARRSVERMCDELLANPVIEQYRFDLTWVKSSPS